MEYSKHPEFSLLALLLALALVVAGCAGPAPAAQPSAAARAAAPAGAAPQPAGTPRVLATENFLADIAQNVAGSRLKIDSLLPTGVDAHSFEPTPQDVARVTSAGVLIVNGAGLEVFLDRLTQNAGGQAREIVASAGLASRTPKVGEATDTAAGETDPHFWLDPNNAVKYAENIRDGLSQADPAGAAEYAANTAAYTAKLRELDTWIAGQVQQVPEAQRLLVTNHEALGYYADRYGFRIVGTVIPSVSDDASPSAQQLARLVDQIRAAHARAIFLEMGTNQQLAQQVAQETGARIVGDLYTHFLSAANGPAPTYIDMLKYDTTAIVAALK